ncbi:MAG TPA: amino acid adenylation domain-containing protein [Streptosporangiaceae bacterium]|nr:amino acid adenylation domain-containing protein [Streptosporangiaceae bacterium]
MPEPSSATMARFLREVRAHPQAPAMEDEHGCLSYAELLATAQAAAGKLTTQGVVPGSRVAVECGYGRDYLIALLAVWLLGATAVPLDPASPAERRLYQVRRAGCDAAVTGPEADGVVAAAVAGREPAGPAGPAEPAESAGPATPAGHDEAIAPAYILFTSGSTGQPKGVVIEHAGLAGMLDCVASRMGLGRGDRTVAHSNPVFDMSMFETVFPLVFGGCLAVAPARSGRNPEIFANWLLSSSADAAIATPSQLRLLLPFLAGRTAVGKLISGGEALTAALAQDLQAVCGVLWNAYGPTEASIIATCGQVTPPWQDPMPIGRVVDGLRAHVLDESLRPVPPGEPGELCLSGPGLARGYIADPEETARAFVTGPEGMRTYRTGDIVVRRPDGQICFQGRRDDQVKVRGHRVELGEVEAAAQRDPRVAHAAALICDVLRAQPELYLAVVAAPGRELRDDGLREHLRRLLPVHMLPSKVLYFAELPTNPSGKIDRHRVRKLVETRLASG